MSPTNETLRWRQRLANLEKAAKQLDAACAQASYSDLELAGLVQVFEYTLELSWKTLKDLLAYLGVDAPTPREVVLRASDAKLLEDPALWLEAIKQRNLFSHTYQEALAEQAEALIKQSYHPMIQRQLATLRQRSEAP